ncbi:MAG TPA: putative Ig domain-containing protein, partial [Pseudolabrys sp.]
MTRSFIPPANPQIQTRAIAHDHADQASLTVPDADLLFSADFKRSGSDLTLIGPNGQKYIIFDYFRFEKRPDLISSDGAVLSAKIVEALAAANTPTQYAQATAPAPSAQIIGKVEKVAGSVTAVRNGVAVTLNVGDALNKSDIVQTGSDSTCGISLLDGTALNLSANTRMALIEFIFDANASSGNASHLTLIQGAFAFVSGLVAPTGGLNIETPVANIGIRGTVGVAVCSVGGNCDFSAGNEVSRDKIGQPSTFELMTGGHYENGRYVDGTVIGTVTVGSTLSVAPAGPGNPPQITFVPAQAADPGLTSLLQQVIQFYPQVFVPPAPPGLQQQQQQQQPQQDQQQQQQNPNPQSGPSGSPQLPPTPPLQQNDHPENLQPLAAITNPSQTFVATVPPEQTAATTTTTAVADAIILSFEPPPPVAVANPIATQSSNEDGTWDFVVPPDTFSGLNNATLTLAASMVDGSPLPNWLSFDAPTATFHGTTPQNANGSVQLQVVATDGQSSIADLFTLNVVPVNDAPIVVNGDVSLPTINENTGNPAGATLATLLNGHFSDQADEVPDGSHANLLAGIAIYSNPANPAGVWEWSVDGTTWNSIATDLSDSHALVLDTSTKIRFVPSAGFHGEAPALLARLIDDSSGSVTNGTFVDLLASGVGDSTPYSADPLNIGEAVNDAPIIDNVGGTVFVAEDVVALLQAPPAAVVTDTDGDTLTMTVSVAHGTLSLGQAVLDAITAGTLTGLDGDGSDGNLSVSGSAAAITAAIQAGITYTADANYNGPDTLGVEITDGLATTNASVAITVTPANDAPTVANAIADQNATQGNAFLFQFASNTFNDVDGDALSYTATLDSGAALPGWLHFDGSTRTFSGTPTNADVGTIAVKVTASDGSAPVSDTFNITVGNTNDAPQGADNTVTTLEDTPRTLTAADFGFSDPNDTPANTLLAVKITTLPAVGTLSNNNVAVSAGQFISIAEINAGLLKFMPAANANGTGYASFTFQVQDNGGGIDLDPTPNTITVDVTPVNDAPTVANAITDQNATQGNLFSFQFAPNAFNDVDGDTLAYTATLDSGAALPSWLSF